MELEDYEVGRALNLWYFCTTEIIVYLIIHQLRTAKAFLHVACLRTPWFEQSSLASPDQYRDTSGEDRAPRDMMVLPCEWAPSTACNSEKGEEDKGGYVHSIFQI